MKWTKTLTCLLLAASIAGSGLGLLSGPDALADEGTEAEETPVVDSTPTTVQEPEPAPAPEPESTPESEPTPTPDLQPTPEPTEETPSDPPSDPPSDLPSDLPSDDADNDNNDDSDPNTEDTNEENNEEGKEENTEQPAETESVALEETETGIAMTVGDKHIIEPIFSPSEMELTWESSNSDIVAVQKAVDSQNAILTAQAAGTVDITVSTPGEKTASCTVTVVEAPKDVTITLNKDDIDLLIGKSFNLKATVESDDEADKDVTWSSSKKNIASVDQNGCVTAQKAGTAIITAKTPGGVSASCTVNVSEPGSVTLNYKQYTLRPSGSILLKATVTPKDAKVTWSTSNKNIATVSENGLVTAKAVGTAIITAKLESGESATCRISVIRSSYPYSSYSPGWYSSLFGSSLFGTTSQYTMPDNIPKNVALTFDCTLGTHTDTVLDALYLYDSFATFFVKSKDIYRKDDRVRRIVGEGHAIGIMLTAEELTSAESALAALDSANSKLSTVCGVPTRLVTIEGGSADNLSEKVYDALRDNGYRVWDWDYQVDETETTAKAAENLEKQLDTTKRVVVRMNTKRRSIQTLETVLGYMRFANMPTRALADSDKPVCQLKQTAE